MELQAKDEKAIRGYALSVMCACVCLFLLLVPATKTNNVVSLFDHVGRKELVPRRLR
jgi:hypothetical protein